MLKEKRNTVIGHLIYAAIGLAFFLFVWFVLKDSMGDSAGLYPRMPVLPGGNDLPAHQGAGR